MYSYNLTMLHSPPQNLANFFLGEVLFFQAWQLDLPTSLQSSILILTPPWVGMKWTLVAEGTDVHKTFWINKREQEEPSDTCRTEKTHNILKNTDPESITQWKCSMHQLLCLLGMPEGRGGWIEDFLSIYMVCHGGTSVSERRTWDTRKLVWQMEFNWNSFMW